MAEERADRAHSDLPALEQWPEDEGSAPHSRAEVPSILRLILRATPRVALAMLLAFVYAAAEGSARLAFLLSWIVVVASMLMPRWRRYVETGQRRRPAKVSTVEVSAPRGAGGAPGASSRTEADPETDDQIDPRDAWELPEDPDGPDPQH